MLPATGLALAFAVAIGSASLVGCASKTASPTDCEESSDAGPCTWLDPSTGLTWQDPLFAERRDWSSAASACAELTLQGRHDWRLPTLDELRSLARGCSGTVTGGSCVVTGTCLERGCWSEDCAGCEEMGGPSPEGCYRLAGLRGDCMTAWTSSLVPDPFQQAWTVGFGGCHVLPYPVDSSLNTRCVR
jgi:hypothetical protein